MNESIDLDKYSVEQLKKIKDGLEKEKIKSADSKTKKQKTPSDSQPIVNFGSTDELLYDNILATKSLISHQTETNRQLEITNKLLLTLFSLEDEKKGSNNTILDDMLKGFGMVTQVVEFNNKTIGENEIIFQGKFEGGLAELLFVSSTSTINNKAYSARIVADDNIIYQDSYTNFEAKQATETDMACFEDVYNTWYLLQFQKVNFMKSILVEIFDSSATFLRIYVKYHKVV